MTSTRVLAIASASLLAAGASACKNKEPLGGPGGAPSGPSGSGTGAGSPGARPADKRITVRGFATPESVLYDTGSDVYLVANINGQPGDADDNGFISRVTPDGKVAELKWIDGAKADVQLDAPKGMAISGDVLWVADLTAVRKFDPRTGAPRGAVTVPGAVFLNDVTGDGDGGIFVSDTGVDEKVAPAGAIYHVARDGQVHPLSRTKDLGEPNGLALVNGSLWVVTAGTGELYEVTSRGEKRPGVKLPKGQLDGIVAKPDGELLVSSWEGKAVYAGKPGGEWRKVLSDVDGPADIGWDGKRNVLLVPQLTESALILLPL